jgi:hypothetical protein
LLSEFTLMLNVDHFPSLPSNLPVELTTIGRFGSGSESARFRRCIMKLFT